MASDRPNAADVLWQSWEDCGEIGRCSAEALRDAVNAGPDDIVCLLPDGTLSVARWSGLGLSDGSEHAHSSCNDKHCRRLYLITRGEAVIPPTCGCPTLSNGDARCHICGEYVNKKCWNCRTPRGDGPCPNPIPGAKP